MKYPRKTIYFKADNVDLYEFLESKGKQASEYVCNLIRADLERDKDSFEELMKEYAESKDVTMKKISALSEEKKEEFIKYLLQCTLNK